MTGIALLNLHRPYFVDVLRDQPDDLLRHGYSPSVMATYRSAYRLIEGLKLLPCTKVPNLLSRMHLPWSHALSAAVSVETNFSCFYRFLRRVLADCHVLVGHKSAFFSYDVLFTGRIGHGSKLI
jgi:hypothetical protein